MGDPKKQKKKYSRPSHPWNKARIDEERVIVREYGLKNKKEIWRVTSQLKKYKDIAKNLIASVGDQAEKEKTMLLTKLYSLGLLDSGAKLEDVLTLTSKELMERRLSTLVFRKGLARTIGQARQFVTHEHIIVGGKKITKPSYIVLKGEEGKIGFAPDSGLMNPEHPERSVPKPKEAPAKPQGKSAKPSSEGAAPAAKDKNN